MTKYKVGDIVHVRLNELTAKYFNVQQSPYVREEDIIAHIPAEPVVRWVNVYRDESWEHHSKEAAFKNIPKRSFNYITTLRIEWPDGDTSKKPVVSVEDV